MTFCTDKLHLITHQKEPVRYHQAIAASEFYNPECHPDPVGELMIPPIESTATNSVPDQATLFRGLVPNVCDVHTVPVDEVMMVPPSPTATNTDCGADHAMLFKLFAVPEVCFDQFVPSDDERTVPLSPTVTNSGCVAEDDHATPFRLFVVGEPLTSAQLAPSGDVVIVPFCPTATNCNSVGEKARLYRLRKVPESCKVHRAPVEEVRIVPLSPATTNWVPDHIAVFSLFVEHAVDGVHAVTRLELREVRIVPSNPTAIDRAPLEATPHR